MKLSFNVESNRLLRVTFSFLYLKMPEVIYPTDYAVGFSEMP